MSSVDFFLIPARGFACVSIILVAYLVACALNAIAESLVRAYRARGRRRSLKTTEGLD